MDAFPSVQGRLAFQRAACACVFIHHGVGGAFVRTHFCRAGFVPVSRSLDMTAAERSLTSEWGLEKSPLVKVESHNSRITSAIDSKLLLQPITESVSKSRHTGFVVKLLSVCGGCLGAERR